MSRSEHAENYAAASDLLARYCRAIDEQDEDLLAGLVTDEVALRANTGAFSAGREPLLDYFRGVWAVQRVPMTHLVANVEVDEDGGPLAVRARFTGLSATDAGVLIVWGRYQDEMVWDEDGTLRFSAKRVFLTAMGPLPANGP